jgi:DNA-binding GntR family transcriptional regulator
MNDGVTTGTTRLAAVGLAHQPLRQAVLDALRAGIIAGQYAPGERLLEDHIAHELDVSRNPVREALQALALEGFVELEPRRGARVATVSRQKAQDLFEVREALEGLVSRLAAERRTEAQLAELQSIVEAGRAAAADGRLTDLPGLNTRFHTTLAAAAGNDLLTEELERLSHVVQWVYSKRIHQRFADSWQEHAAILAAIERQDSHAALAAASLHIAQARSAFLAEGSLPD